MASADKVVFGIIGVIVAAVVSVVVATTISAWSIERAYIEHGYTQQMVVGRSTPIWVRVPPTSTPDSDDEAKR